MNITNRKSARVRLEILKRICLIFVDALMANGTMANGTTEPAPDTIDRDDFP
jgi:hypothetical protein